MSFCAVPESSLETADAQVCRWPAGHVITYRIDGKLPQFSDAEYLEIFELATSLWEAKSGVRIEHKATGPANVVILTKAIDGQAGVLAQAELPCGNITPSTRLRQWYDTHENWVHAANPPAAKMDLLRVAAHEWGHSLGIGHETTPGVRALMDPKVSEIRTLQPWDIEQIRLRYGDPSNTPPPGGNGCDMFLKQCFPDAAQRKQMTHAWELFKRAMRNGG